MNIRLPPDLKAELIQTSEDRCVSANLIVERAVRRFLNDLAPLETAPPALIRPTPPPDPIDTGIVPLDPPFHCVESGLYVPVMNNDGRTARMVKANDSGFRVQTDECPTIHQHKPFTIGYIAADRPGLNVTIGPRLCRHPDCDNDADSGPWCLEHLQALLEQPDPEPEPSPFRPLPRGDGPAFA
jgi:hypothetical protein